MLTTLFTRKYVLARIISRPILRVQVHEYHFDNVVWMRNWEICLTSYAHMACGSRKFNLMLCVTSEKNAAQIILLNYGKKFKYLGQDVPNYGRWLEPEITALVDNLLSRDAAPIEVRPSLIIL